MANGITPLQHAMFLREQYERQERVYKSLCDECGELAARLAEKRQQADDAMTLLNECGKELLKAMKEIRPC